MSKKAFGAWMCLLFAGVFLFSALLSIWYAGSAPMRLLAVEWNETVGTIHHGLPYQDGLHYDLYIPADIDQTSPQHLLLFIHGGSFNSGAKEDGDAWCKYFASQGYIAATLDYSLQGKGRPIPLQQMNDEIAACVAAIDAYCTSLGCQIDGMAPVGVSAGGTLAMNYAYTCADSSAIPVRFVCQLAGPADFQPEDWGLLKQANGITSDEDFIAMMAGNGSIDEISPARLITPASVPTLMGYGLRDHVIPGNQRLKMTEALRSNGVPFECHEFPNSNHGLYADLDVLQIFLDQLLAWCERYF